MVHILEINTLLRNLTHDNFSFEGAPTSSNISIREKEKSFFFQSRH